MSANKASRERKLEVALADTDLAQEVESAIKATENAPVGGGIPVLLVDPSSPTLNQQWVLRVVEVNPTFATATLGSGGFPSVIEFSIPTPTLSDLQTLGGVFLTTISWTNGAALVVGNNGNDTITIQYEGGVSTVQNVVDALNGASQGLISKNTASVGSDVVGGDSFTDKIGVDSSAPVATDGALGSYTQKIQGDSVIFTQSFTRP